MFLIFSGLFVGSSSALNIVAACRVARSMAPGSTVVTIVCDSGHRHMSRFWNPEFITSCSKAGMYDLKWPEPGVVPKCLV